MRILVFTSSMTDADFNDYACKARIKPNPSNQNFHNKLIRALGMLNEVAVITLRPFIKGMFKEKSLDRKTVNENDITYHYAPAKAGRLYKLFKEEKVITEFAERIITDQHYGNFLIVTDTLRRNLLKAALNVAKKHDVPCVGVVTDDPFNLSGVHKSHARHLIRNGRRCDAYIVLTKALNRLYNPRNRPFYLLEGLVDDVPESQKKPLGDYFFFAGALYKRYGVKTLLDAYHGLKTDVSLIIAGRGELRPYIFDLTQRDRRILYLDLIDRKTVYDLEQHAVANINPRPDDEKLAEESVPSKLLEYLASGAPTISTRQKTLTPLFFNECTWILDPSEAGLRKTLADFLNADQTELRKNALAARLRVYDLYGLRGQGESLARFLASLRTSSRE